MTILVTRVIKNPSEGNLGCSSWLARLVFLSFRIDLIEEILKGSCCSSFSFLQAYHSPVLTVFIQSCWSCPFPFTKHQYLGVFSIPRWTGEKKTKQNHSPGNSSFALQEIVFIQSLSVGVHLVGLLPRICLAHQIHNGEGWFWWVQCHVCSQTKVFLNYFV